VVVAGAAVEGGVDGPLVVVLVERPLPPGEREGWSVVLVVDGAGALVPVVEVDVVEVEVVGAPVSLSSAGAVVVVVVGDGSGVVVVVVVGSDGSVVDVVSFPVDGSATPVSAPAGAAGTQTRAVKMVVRARARRTRRTWSTSGRDGGLSPMEMFQNDDIVDGAGVGVPPGLREPGR